MAEILSDIPETGYTYRDELPVSVRKSGDRFEEARTALADISRRIYTCTWTATNAERQTLDDFLRSVNFGQDAFYFLDPRDDALADVSIGTGDNSEVTFSLPASGENRRWYPVDDTDEVVVKVSGSPVTIASIDSDARTVTLDTPPAMSAPVTYSGPVYRLVRLEGEAQWQQLFSNFFRLSMTLMEVVSATG